MTISQMVLVVIGVVGLAESTWGMTSPARLRKVVAQAFADAPDRNWVVGAFFACLALGLWLLMSPERAPVDYALLFLSWLFAGGALANFTYRGFQAVLSFLILDRSDRGVRLLYVGEFAAACVLIGLGVSGG